MLIVSWRVMLRHGLREDAGNDALHVQNLSPNSPYSLFDLQKEKASRKVTMIYHTVPRNSF